MKSRVFLQSILGILVFVTPLWVWALSWDVVSTWSTTQSSNWLLLSGITVDDDMHIRMDFTQNIVIDSVRLRIAKQADGTNIKVESLTGVLDSPKSLMVTLSDVLEAWDAYTMTVISALSDKWVTITEWTDALSEFQAPDPLKKSLVVFDAAPNPTATIVATEEKPETMTTDTAGSETTDSAPTTEDDATPPVPENSELPLTGMNPIIFIILSSLIALGIILRKKV